MRFLYFLLFVLVVILPIGVLRNRLRKKKSHQQSLNLTTDKELINRVYKQLLTHYSFTMVKHHDSRLLVGKFLKLTIIISVKNGTLRVGTPVSVINKSEQFTLRTNLNQFQKIEENRMLGYEQNLLFTELEAKNGSIDERELSRSVEFLKRILHKLSDHLQPSQDLDEYLRSNH